MKRILITLVSIFTLLPLLAEVVYLNDGTILNGTIIDENASTVTIQTKYQTRTISHSQIKRILYGERQLEEIHILMKNGDRIHAYQVIQDNEKVIIRRSMDDPKEETIYKKDIRQMGPEEIMVFNPEIDVSGGMVYFLNPGSSDLGYAYIARASMYYDIPVVAHTKACLDTGYASGSGSGGDLLITFIPIYLSGIYEFTVAGAIVYPKLGAGATILSMDDKVKDPVQGVVFSSIIGGGAAYPLIKEKLYFRIELDEVSLWESSSLHTLMATAGLGYRF